MSTYLEREIAGLEQGDHLCLLYETVEEQLAAAVPYVKNGLSQGERCLYIVDDRTAEEVANALSGAAIDVGHETKRGALVLLTKRDTYLRSGAFDPESMIALLRQARDDALAAGFGGLRATGEMTWALGPEAGTDRLIEYEARLNEFFPGSRAGAICQYNLRRFPPASVRQVLRTHPIAILGRRVCPNLYYEPPEFVLGEPSEAKQVEWIISQLKHAHGMQDALRRSEVNYRALVENATYGIYRSSPGGQFLTVNPALVEMLGYESEDELLAVDMSSDVYADPGESTRLATRYEAVQRIDGLECEWKRKDGTLIKVRLSGRRIPKETAGVECFEMIVEDVTEQRKLEDQLRQAQKMEAVGQLTGGIAHDFNNILSVILLNTELLASALEATQKELLPDVQEINEAARKAATMTKRLLGLSRQADLTMVPTDLAQVVADLSSMLRRVLPESIHVQITTDAPVPAVQVDAGAVEQVLLNLATNARDAMPGGGELQLDVCATELDDSYCVWHPLVEPGTYVCVTVSDTGIGMDKETQARIFDPFFTTKPSGEGTGLGMAMVYGLTKQQGGSVHVYSEVGRGTTVRLYFPAVKQAAGALPERISAAEVRGGTETILLVEDEDTLRRSAKRVLQMYGYTVLVAADGEDALKIYRTHKAEIDLVFSDLVMPKMGGRQLYQALRQEAGSVKFLMASGYTGREAKERNALDPSLPFVQKPWNLTDFLARVREVLDQDTGGQTSTDA